MSNKNKLCNGKKNTSESMTKDRFASSAQCVSVEQIDVIGGATELVEVGGWHVLQVMRQLAVTWG